MGTPRLALVGTFVVGGLLLLAVGLFMIGDRRLLFTDNFEVVADFGNVTGVQISTNVRLAGFAAGEVLEIEIPPSPGGRFQVRMRVREDLHSLVRTDSVAAILTDGLLGSVFIQIRSGSDDAPTVPGGGTIRGIDAIEFADLVEEGRNTFRTVTEELLILRRQASETFLGLTETVATTTRLIDNVNDNVRTVTEASALFVTDARGLLAETQGVAAETRSVVAHIAAGEGTVGKLLTDEALYTHVTGIARETEATLRAVRGSAEEVQQIVKGYAEPDSATNQLLADASDAMVQAREAMSDLAENTEALKRNWLFSGFFTDRGFFNLDELTIDEYRELLRSDRYTPLRIWLDGDLLFGPDPGDLTLNDDAKRRLDEAMSELLRYPRDSPLVVEGYATGGGRGQEFITAQGRADTVRGYLTRTFRRSATLTGTMPIGADAEGSPSGDGRWSGVALTVFVDPERLDRSATP